MRFPVSVPGLEGQRVEVVTSQLTGSLKVMVNGNPVLSGKKRGEFLIRCPDGRQAVLQITPKFALDGAIRITVNGVPQVLGIPLKPNGTLHYDRDRNLSVHASCWHCGQIFTAKIAPTQMDTFRLIIRKSANPAYPNAAQISEIALYPPENR